MDQRSPGMRDGRGLGRADLYARDGELLASVAQLGTIRSHLGEDMTTQSLVEEYLGAVNSHDWATLERVFHPDVEIVHGMTLSTTGREKAIKLLTAIVAQFAEHEDRPTRFIVDGDTAAVEITFVGTQARRHRAHLRRRRRHRHRRHPDHPRRLLVRHRRGAPADPGP